MIHIFLKEINSFFSSLIGYIVIGVFLITLGLFLWVFPETSLLEYGYATLFPFFSMTPLVFIFLIPAITMRSFAEENQNGTIELLATKPLTDWDIILGKYFACWALVIFALLPTILYYITIYQLGSPIGNLDSGATMGSYFGLIFLAGAFVAMGLFASSLTTSQIVAFILGVFLCFFFFLAFDYFSVMNVFFGIADVIQSFGINAHYESISKGILDTRDVIYFVSFIVIFIILTFLSVSKRKWT